MHRDTDPFRYPCIALALSVENPLQRLAYRYHMGLVAITRWLSRYNGGGTLSLRVLKPEDR